jgi:hypothetical protein
MHWRPPAAAKEGRFSTARALSKRPSLSQPYSFVIRHSTFYIPQMSRSFRFLCERDLEWLLAALGVWLVVAYLALPVMWKRHERRHPALENAPTITHTGSMIPGDPINLSFIGQEADLVGAMLAAGWHPADAITLKSSLRIAESTLFHRAYLDAPVSNLFLYGRKEDLAFEKPAGPDASKRHHVRFWKSPELDAQGRPCWFGAVTFDRSVGFSHTTGQITHHIGPDLDAERDHLVEDLQNAGRVESLEWQNDFQPTGEGRNGGGDHWQTDRRLAIVVLKPSIGKASTETPPPPSTDSSEAPKDSLVK